MKSLIAACMTAAAVAATAVLAGCQGTAVELSTAQSEADAFADAQSTWKAGVHTFSDMKNAYGPPANYTETPNGGHAARWVRKTRVLAETPGLVPGGPVRQLEALGSGPHHYTTVTGSLEAFYGSDGILSSFRVNLTE